MQMYVLAALLGATSAIKNNMPTAVAAPAFTAFTVSWIKLTPPRLTPALDTPPTI
jgi:hypothetical protein